MIGAAEEQELEQLTTDGKIRRLLGTMPYGGAASFTYPGEGFTLEDVVDNLLRLRKVLREVSQREHELTSRLWQYRSILSHVATMDEVLQGARQLSGEVAPIRQPSDILGEALTRVRVTVGRTDLPEPVRRELSDVRDYLSTLMEMFYVATGEPPEGGKVPSIPIEVRDE